MSEPAFPVSTIDGFTNEGMTKREWFAGLALAGFAASPAALGKWSDGTVAKCAFEIADAMIAASKGETP